MQHKAARSTVGTFILAIFTTACLAGAYHFMDQGLNELAQARQIQRLPVTPLSILAQGPYLVTGQVSDRLGTYTAPYSKTQAVYVRYLKQQEYRDTDGDRKLRTIDSGHLGGKFQLQDESGSVVVNPGSEPEDIDWGLSRTWHDQTDDYVYSEWALKPTETATIIGQFDPDHQELKFGQLEAFSLPSVISTFDPSSNTSEEYSDSGAHISLATGLLAMGLALGLILLKIHRLWVYALTMTVAVSGTLSLVGVSRMTQEWSAIATLYEGRYQKLADSEAPTLALADVAVLNHLIHQSTNGWFDRWMFRQQLENRLPLPELNEETQLLVQQALARHHPTKHTLSAIGIFLAIGSLILAAFLMHKAIRSIKLKRLIEAVPTSNTKGLSFGLAELSGKVESDDQHPPLHAPLTNKKCVAYHYKIEESKGSGKDDKWRTIESHSEHVPFRLNSHQGGILVYPEGATFEYSGHHKSREGNQRHTVKYLEPGADIYCLGFAGLDQQQPDRLSIQHEPGLPFMINASDEAEIVLHKGAWGFAGIAASLGLFLFTATSFLIADGRFSPDNLLISALVVPLVLCVYTTILHYNDLVFLKNRVSRARANIDTILQQRHDLWPMLEDAVKVSMAHEKELLTTIATLRAAPPVTLESTHKVGQTIRQEQSATQSLKAKLERYPDLKNHQVVLQFMELMTNTENYLSLLRDSYTDSACIYNTRIQTLPDLVLAWLFKFRPAPTLDD
ncbi:LemA family protein [Marinobacter sp.]|uniref:LemA family protein n=1 Tax=Marinobacter sp. TaxID=50741 RepID=UPI00356A5F83